MDEAQATRAFLVFLRHGNESRLNIFNRFGDLIASAPLREGEPFSIYPPCVISLHTPVRRDFKFFENAIAEPFYFSIDSPTRIAIFTGTAGYCDDPRGEPDMSIYGKFPNADIIRWHFKIENDTPAKPRPRPTSATANQ